MGIIYAGGFLVGAWLLIRRLSRKEHQFHERDLPTTEDISEETEEE